MLEMHFSSAIIGLKPVSSEFLIKIHHTFVGTIGKYSMKRSSRLAENCKILLHRQDVQNV